MRSVRHAASTSGMVTGRDVDQGVVAATRKIVIHCLGHISLFVVGEGFFWGGMKLNESGRQVSRCVVEVIFVVISKFADYNKNDFYHAPGYLPPGFIQLHSPPKKTFSDHKQRNVS